MTRDMDVMDYVGLGITGLAFIALLPLLLIFLVLYWLGLGFAALLKRLGVRP